MRRRTIAAVFLGIAMGSCMAPAHALGGEARDVVRALNRIAKVLERCE